MGKKAEESKPQPKPVKSQVRVCQTCQGAGTKETSEVVEIDGVKQKVTKTIPCPARCNNGAINIRNI